MKTFFKLFFALFILMLSPVLEAQIPERSGWWKFDDALDITQAAIGNSLLQVGTMQSVPGPVDGNMAASIGVGSYFEMTHGMYGNGGGSMVNEYTIQIDFSVPETGIWHSFFQTDPTNSDDGDLFTSNSSNAVGTAATGYSNKGVSVDNWYRMVVSVRNGEFFRIYMNGELWLDGAAQSVDGRFALGEKVLMFADNDGEDGIVLCSELGVWDVALDEDQVYQLGDAAGDRARTRDRMGWWKFDNPSDLLNEEVGYPLELVGSQESVPGPAEGNLATRLGLGSYFKITHDIGLNGEETLVNEYSLQIDFSVPDKSVWHAFFQTNPLNGDDADLFAKNSNYTIGTAQTGYSTNAIESDTWYRMIVSVKNDEFFRVYLNGSLWLDAPAQGTDGRFGLDDILLIFADDDGDDGEIICSELCIWEVALTENEVLELGGDPSASLPARSGWWLFDDTADLLKATVGSPLEVSGTEVASNGPVEGNGAVTIGLGSHFLMTHGIASNGGGSLVNDYSIQVDFSIPETGVWYSFIQTTLDNSDDADLFINSSASSIGTAATGYSSNSVLANTWYRMIVSVRNGSFFKIYMNGELWLESAGQNLDGRFALADQLIVFGDNDGDDGTINCSELGIWNVALSQEQVVKLGDATTSIPTGIIKKHVSEASLLGQNFPNPFSTSTRFPYKLISKANVSFSVLDLSGRELRHISQGVKEPGDYMFHFNAEGMAPGVYYLRMNAGMRSEVQKMIITR